MNTTDPHHPMNETDLTYHDPGALLQARVLKILKPCLDYWLDEQTLYLTLNLSRPNVARAGLEAALRELRDKHDEQDGPKPLPPAEKRALAIHRPARRADLDFAAGRGRIGEVAFMAGRAFVGSARDLAEVGG